MTSPSVPLQGWAACGLTALCQPSTRMKQVTEGPICHLWDPSEPGLWSVAGPAGLSSKEFFGLHCQMPVQFCHGVIGHLADLFFYEPNGIL